MWLAPSPSPPGPAVPDRHDEHGVDTFNWPIWPPADTSTWPPVVDGPNLGKGRRTLATGWFRDMFYKRINLQRSNMSLITSFEYRSDRNVRIISHHKCGWFYANTPEEGRILQLETYTKDG